METHLAFHRFSGADATANAIHGSVTWHPAKSVWFTAHALVVLGFSWSSLGTDTVALSFVLTAVTLCLGHTTGLHRLLVHRSFACPKWLEYLLVHLGVVVGMGGPFDILYMHDIRDWAQRHTRCHPFFTDSASPWKDWLWQTHCRMRLDHPPRFEMEERVAADPVYRFMQRTWMLQQLPWAILCFAIAGFGGVVWGISVRIVVSLTGHWFVGWLAHNHGQRDWHLEGHAVQGFNLRYLGLITMGEGWHNNHHAFPESARLGFTAAQSDPGWWVICLLMKLGLAWSVTEPADLPERPERHRLHDRAGVRLRSSAYFDLHLF